MNYLKIFSKIHIEHDIFQFDYDRQEDEPEEQYRYEYFVKQEEDEPDSCFLETLKTCVEYLDATVDRGNYSFNNQSGFSDAEIGL